MDYVVLARKYRPRTFDDVVGQEHVLRVLRNSLRQKRLHQAYLLTGTRGVGKTTIARILAKAFNCHSGITDEPCGQCPACCAIDAGAFVDFLELDAATHTKVDDMRQILEKVVYPPVVGRFKVYVIDEVHMLSHSAFNAMLKTLEEPPAYMKFIFATTDVQKIPLSVLSRCLNLSLRCLSVQQIFDRLAVILNHEKISGDDESLMIVAQAAAGSLRDALSLLDQSIAYGSGVLSGDAVRAMLGVADYGQIISLFHLLSQDEIHQALSCGRVMLAQGSFLSDIYSGFIRLFHQMAVLQLVPDDQSVDVVYRDRIVSLLALYTPEDIQLFYQIASLSRQNADAFFDPAVLLDMFLIRLYAFSPRMTRADAAHQLPVGHADGPSSPSVSSEVKKQTTQSPAVKKQTGAEPTKENQVVLLPRATSPQSQSDWMSLCRSIAFEGIVRQFVENCTWLSSDDTEWRFGVNRLAKSLFPVVQKRLEQTLSQVMERPIRVAVSDLKEQSMGDESFAHQRKEKKIRDHRDALDFLHHDSHVRQLVDCFDGELDVSSLNGDLTHD